MTVGESWTLRPSISSMTWTLLEWARAFRARAHAYLCSGASDLSVVRSFNNWLVINFVPQLDLRICSGTYGCCSIASLCWHNRFSRALARFVVILKTRVELEQHKNLVIFVVVVVV